MHLACLEMIKIVVSCKIDIELADDPPVSDDDKANTQDDLYLWL